MSYSVDDLIRNGNFEELYDLDERFQYRCQILDSSPSLFGGCRHSQANNEWRVTEAVFHQDKIVFSY
jgi:hypothetical protein